MAYEQILTETRGRVGVLRLNRPEKLNAWTDVMANELSTQIQAWNEDDSIGAIVIAGEGRAFAPAPTSRASTSALWTTPRRLAAAPGCGSTGPT